MRTRNNLPFHAVLFSPRVSAFPGACPIQFHNGTRRIWITIFVFALRCKNPKSCVNIILISIPQQAHFTLLDLELLHHFLVYTYNSLARNNTAEIWRVNIPELAYTRDWLMRGLLSISAMHMVAEKEPDPQKTSDLISTAATSLNAGLAVVNHLVATADLSDKPTCSALASYTALVAVYALAMPTVQHHASIRLGMRGVSEPLDDAIGQLYTSFELVRGTAEVYRKVWHAISTGPMAPLTQVSIFSDSYDFITEYEGLLSKLKSHQNSEPMAKELSPRRQVLERIKNIKEWIDERIVNRARIKAACYLAQDRLSQIVLRVLVPEPSLSRGLIFAWPATFESLFMELLQEQYPPALALLAVFALILRGSSWLTRGWKWWILDALMEIRHAHGVHGDDVDDVWWCTISWAAQLAKNHPDFLESSLEDEGFA